MAAVGGLIRRMDVRKGIGDIAAALVKALTADGCVIDKRIDFQNDRLVLPGQLEMCIRDRVSIFAIGDLHLPGGDKKPMDVFGSHWEHHFERICACLLYTS